MSNLLVVSASGQETRLALIEDGSISEFYLERKKERGIVGNIYKGRVSRVLPGMQAAFVDIGIDKAAFLYVGDIAGTPDFELQADLAEGEHADIDHDDQASDEGTEPRLRGRGRRKESVDEKPIQDLLQPGQEIVVQVAKEPMGTKGPRITCHVSLPGRHLVFMPTVEHIGISRRIGDARERKRLRSIIDAHRPAGTGFIVRTVAEGVPDDKLKADIQFLVNLWAEIGRKNERMRAPALLHGDLDLVLRSVRDLFGEEVDKLVIDDRREHDRVHRWCDEHLPHLKPKIELFEGDEPIFDAYGVEAEIRRALQRKVWLKSGGYIVIDQAEALTAIDVNSGRYVGKKNLEETITKTNIEAAKEIVYQLRLRNIGGIIIIDFIDMEKAENRNKVYRALEEALKADRAKTNVLKISGLGLVEMTRKRVRESIGRLLTSPCPTCEGRGVLKSMATLTHEIFREIHREAPHLRDEALVVNCHPDVARMLQTDEREALRGLMNRLNKTVQVRPQPAYKFEQFDVVTRPLEKRALAAAAGARPGAELLEGGAAVAEAGGGGGSPPGEGD